MVCWKLRTDVLGIKNPLLRQDWWNLYPTFMFPFSSIFHLYFIFVSFLICVSFSFMFLLSFLLLFHLSFFCPYFFLYLCFVFIFFSFFIFIFIFFSSCKRNSGNSSFWMRTKKLRENENKKKDKDDGKLIFKLNWI